jgi:drug/metabolite transporter, DME family
VTEISETIDTTTETTTAKKSRKGILWLIFACSLWGTVGVSSGLLNQIEQTPSLTIGFLRLAFSAPLLLGLAWYTTGCNPLKVERAGLPLCLGMGLAMAMYQLFYFAAIPISSVTLVVVIALCSAPVIVAVLSIPIFKEQITPILLVALFLALVGTALLAFGGNSTTTAENPNVNYLLGAILALGAGFSYSILTILSRIAAKRPENNGTQFLAVAFTFGAIILLGAALATGTLKLNLAPGVWLITAYLGIVPTGLAYIIFVFALRSVSATVTTIVTLLEPAIAALLAWLLLGETITVLTVGGGGLLLASVYLLSRRL